MISFYEYSGMSNTATAAMVCPIAMAVLEELYPKVLSYPCILHGHNDNFCND